MPDTNLDRYLAWRRLTHAGKRRREDMSPVEQREYDALGVKQEPPPDAEEAKRAYEEITRRSDPGSSAST